MEQAGKFMKLGLLSLIIFLVLTAVAVAGNRTIDLHDGTMNVNGTGYFSKGLSVNSTFNMFNNSTGFYYNGSQTIGYLTNSTKSKIYYYLETTGGFTFSDSAI